MIDALEFLKSAVAIPSVSGDEAVLARHLVERMGVFAESVVDEAGNVVAKVGSGLTEVYFLGHIDTVPGDIPVEIGEGRLYGRGSVDAKGSFCCAAVAASRLPSEVLSALTFTVIGAVEEELPSSKGARFALEAFPAPEFLIIGEPSGWDAVTLGYKGRLVAKMEVETGNFHSAAEGQTAAERMVEVWQRLRSWSEVINAGISGIFDTLQLSLQDLCSGSDGLRQTAQAVVGMRLPLEWPPERTEKAIREVLKDCELKSLEFTGHERAYRGPKDSRLSRAFRLAIRQGGGKPRFKLKTGTSDMNVVAPHWQVPVLAYGPGDSSLDHTPDEHLELLEYERAIAVFVAALTELARQVKH